MCIRDRNEVVFSENFRKHRPPAKTTKQTTNGANSELVSKFDKHVNKYKKATGLTKAAKSSKKATSKTSKSNKTPKNKAEVLAEKKANFKMFKEHKHTSKHRFDTKEEIAKRNGATKIWRDNSSPQFKVALPDDYEYQTPYDYLLENDPDLLSYLWEEKLDKGSIHTYMEKVLNGEIVVCENIRLLCERQAEMHQNPPEGFYFDFKRAMDIIAFALYVPLVDEAAASGEFFVPEAWQVFFLTQIYGWRSIEDPEKRLYTKVFCQVAKKNTKTFLAGIITSYEMIHVRMGSESQIYSVATQRDQAALCFDMAKKFYSLMPDEIIPYVAYGSKEIYTELGDKFMPLPHKPQSYDGKNSSCIVYDEAAAIPYKDASVFTKLATGASGGRGEGKYLELYITTAQNHDATPYLSFRESEWNKLREGTTEMSTFPMFYEVDEDDEPLEDPSCWIKANPNLGVSISHRSLEQAVQEAKEQPFLRAEILNHRFNAWERNAIDMWLEEEDWDACKGTVIKDGPAYIGVDGAVSDDFFAISTLYFPKPDQAHLVVRCYLPQDTFDNLPKEIKPIYEAAIEDRELVLTKGKTIKEERVLAYLKSIFDKRDVQLVGVDRKYLRRIIDRLEDDYGEDKILEVKQHANAMWAGISDFEDYVKDCKLIHRGSDFLKWQFMNVRTKEARTSGDEVIYLLEKADAIGPRQRKIDAMTSTAIAFKVVEEPEDVFKGLNILYSS